MRRVCFILVAFTLLVAYAVALDLQSSKQAAFGDDANADSNDDDDDYEDDYDYALQDKKGHKHKKKIKMILFGGGLKSLIAFIAIKIKLILIVVTVIGIIGFTLKVFGALKYAGYIGGQDCPVIHESAYGLGGGGGGGGGYSVTPPPPDHVAGYGEPWANDHETDWSSSGGSYARSLIENYIDTDFMSHALKNMDIAETIFTALEMDNDQCRRRLVCEIDAKTRQIPLISYAMDFFSHGFEKYRTPGETKYNECAKLYSGCDDRKESKKRRKRFVGKNKRRNYVPA